MPPMECPVSYTHLFRDKILQKGVRDRQKKQAAFHGGVHQRGEKRCPHRPVQERPVVLGQPGLAC